jgi:hypothetical protein
MFNGEPMHQRPRPCWNVISVVAPFAGLVLAIPYGLMATWITGDHPASMAKPSASFFAISVAFGLFAGCVAWWRSERLWGISIVGVVVNAAILMLLLYWDPWSGPF